MFNLTGFFYSLPNNAICELFNAGNNKLVAVNIILLLTTDYSQVTIHYLSFS